MNRRVSASQARGPEKSSSGPILWRPGGGEVYVHSKLSEPYGDDDADGLDDVLAPGNIKVARECRLIDVRIENGSTPLSEGLRKIGEILLRTVTIVDSESKVNTTGLVKVEPIRRADSGKP